MHKHIYGCLLGGALGDAIGSHFENQPPTTNAFIPNELRVSDDTQLTLATCEAIIETKTVDPESIARHFTRWYRERRLTGLGSSTLKALIELDAGQHWAMVGTTGERAAGCGAAMRIAPLAFLLDPDNDTDRQVVHDVCRITHRHDEAYIGALTVVRAIRLVSVGISMNEESLKTLIVSLPDSLVRDRLIAINNSSMTINAYALRFGSSGYVVDAVPLAILAAMQSTDVMTTIGEIIMCGGDTDTIASIYGQIHGAKWGDEAIPNEYIGRIVSAEFIRDVADQFSRTILGPFND